MCQIYKYNVGTCLWHVSIQSFGGLFDEMGVLHVVEPGVEEADLGNYGQSEE